MLHPYAIAFEELWRATAPRPPTEDAPPDDDPSDDGPRPDDDRASAGAASRWAVTSRRLTGRWLRPGLPRLRPDLEEAARVDGAGPVRIFFSVIAPLAKPAYATMAILGFLFSWGQFRWPVMVTRGVSVRPLPLGIGVFKTTPPIQWGDIMAYAALMTLPLLIVFLIFQRHFVEGVARSGVKG